MRSVFAFVLLGCWTVWAAPVVVKTQHPRLFAEAQTFERIKGDVSPLARSVRDKVIAEADAVLNEPPVERMLEGRRLLTVSRRVVSRLLHLSMAYKLTDDRRYLARAKREIRAVGAFSDWNPSHFLDTAEMMFAVAVAYDWLYDSFTYGERTAIRKMLVEKGLKGGHEDSRWMNWGNNWNLVCHTGYLAAALAIADEEPVLAESYVSAAVELMPIALKAYEGGNFPEGPSIYWAYATEYLSCALEMLQSACGTTYGLDRLPGIAEQADYQNVLTGPSGLFFNYSDAGAEPVAHPRSFSVANFFLAKHFNRPDALAEFEIGGLKRKLSEEPEGNTRRSYGRFLPLILFWLPESEPVVPVDLALSTYLGGANPVASMRSAWGDPKAAYLAIKGGGPGHSHAHQDGGSFVFDWNGVRWFHDLGSENYHVLETAGVNLWNGGDGSDRWRVSRYSLPWHNAIRIDGCDQTVKGNGVFVNPTAQGFGSVTIDLTSLYTNAVRVVRTAKLAGESFSVHDEIVTHPGAVVVWSGIVHGQPRAEGRVLRLLDCGRTLDVVGSSDWTIEDISAPPHSYESANPGFFRVMMTVVAPASGRVDILCQGMIK